MTALLIVCGKWVTGGIQVVMAIYNCRTYLRGDHQVDATDVFQKLGFQKKLRIGKLVFYLATFVLIIYKYAALYISWLAHLSIGLTILILIIKSPLNRVVVFYNTFS